MADPAVGIGAVGIVMGFVDESAFRIPDVFAVDGHCLVEFQVGDSRGEIDVMGDEQGLAGVEFYQESLMAAAIVVIGKFVNDGAAEFHHEAAGLVFESAGEDAVAGAEFVSLRGEGEAGEGGLRVSRSRG